jgi:hypothetical protein
LQNKKSVSSDVSFTMPAGAAGKWRLNFSSQIFWLLMDDADMAEKGRTENTIG